MRRDRAWRRSLFVSATAAWVFGACQPGAAKFPWGEGARCEPVERADVRTLNEGYARTCSQVLLREVSCSSRAALEYAAYHSNCMIADTEPESPLPPTAVPDTSHPFAGPLESGTLTADLSKT